MAKNAVAGFYGEEVRSDCRVELNTRSSGGIEIALSSRVETLYGSSIRDLIRSVLMHFGLAHASVSISDSGALDFVIAARVEAAIKKAVDTCEEFIIPRKKHPASVGKPSMIRTTRLYLPGNTPRLMINAGIHRPDGIVLDLEDSVAPERKEEARILVRNALENIDFMGAEKMVRINQLPEGMLDLEYIVPRTPDMILLPKTEDPDQVRRVETRIREINGRKNREIFLMPIIESALGIERAYQIAGASGSIVAMAIGLEDYTADLGVQRTRDGSESLYARTRLVNACAASGIQAVDSVYPYLDDESGLRVAAERSRSLGFQGMGCIHPRQIPVIRDAFKPSHEEIISAGKIIHAFEKAEKQGLSVTSLESKMIDPPVVKRAMQTIDLALKLKLIPGNWRELNA